MDVTPRSKTVWNIFGTRVTITKQCQVKSMCRYLELWAALTELIKPEYRVTHR